MAQSITILRKPFEGLLTHNVVRHGTGAFNVEGTRIPTDEPVRINTWTAKAKYFGGAAGMDFTSRHDMSGRWPANLVVCKQVALDLEAEGQFEFSRFFFLVSE